MNITIVKNSTTIICNNDELINYRRDGGLNTLRVSFYSDNDNLLDRWDRVSAMGKSWRVSSTPAVKIDYEEDVSGNYQWLYTVVLIEAAAVLKGHYMPDIAFTQNLAGTKTIIDAIETILSKQSVRVVGESQKYTLSSTVDLSIADQLLIAPNDIFVEKSLFDILAYYGELLDAKPVLDETDNTIDFIYNNTVNDSIVLEPDFFELEISKNTEDYATGVKENAKNVNLKNITNYYPAKGKRVHFIPLNLESNMGYDNATLELPFKAKRVSHIQCYIHDDPVRIINLYDKKKTVEPLEYDKYIYEEKEWNTLKSESLWANLEWFDWGVLRKNSLYYKYGDHKIYNLSALEYHATQAGYSLSHLKQLLVRVEYEALPDLEIEYISDERIDGDIEYIERLQQQASTIDHDAELLKLKNDLNNRKSIFYNVGWISDGIPNIESIIQVNQVTGTPQCLITSMAVKKIGAKYEINARLATEYSKKNPLTRAINQNRIFEIPTDQIVTRKIVLEVQANFWGLVGATLPSHVYNTSWPRFQNFFFDLKKGEYNNSGEDLEYVRGSNFILAKFYSGDIGYTRVLMPYVRFNNKLSEEEMHINFITSMTSNTSVDMQRFIDSTVPVNYTAKNAIVTDEFGEIDNVQLSFMKVKNDSISSEVLSENDIIFTDSTPTDYTFKEAYPFTSPDYSNNLGFKIEAVTPVEEEIIINKDAREKLQFQIKLKVTQDSYTEVNFDVIDTFLDWTSSTSFGNTPSIEATIDGVLTLCVYDSIEYYRDYIKINFSYPVTGLVTDVRLCIDGDEFIKVNINKAVTLEQNDYLAIYITDKL
jgi:hypothetical protein